MDIMKVKFYEIFFFLCMLDMKDRKTEDIF